MPAYIDKKLVFCIDCRWFLFGEYGLIKDCRYPLNVTKKITWLEAIDEYIKTPQELNRDNNCTWFADKRLKKMPKVSENNKQTSCLNGE